MITQKEVLPSNLHPITSDKPSCTPEEHLSAALEEYAAAVDRGEPLSKEALLAKYPDVADELAGCLDCLEFIHHIAPQLNEDLSAAAKSAAPIRPLATLGDFRIVREIGRGGMGVVYEAEQLSLGRRVALKVLPFAAMLEKRSLQRFKHEAFAAATLDHPNIVSIYSVGEERGVHFFAMQLIRGQTLADLIGQLRRERHFANVAQSAHLAHNDAEHVPASDSNDRPSSQTHKLEQAPLSTRVDFQSASEFFRSAARLVVQAAEALQHAHDQGVLHRDIKPGNLMLDAEGQLYVTDFGLARIETDVGLTMTGDVMGTLRYMAPEQVLAKRGVVDQRADVYSLGATLYELLSLESAFSQTDRSALLKQIAFEEPRPLRRIDRRIPAELETIVRKAMAKNRDDRYQSVQQLGEDLERFLDHRPIFAKPPGILARIMKWSRRYPAQAALIAVTGLALAALWAGTLWHAKTLSAALRQSEQHRAQAQRSEQQALAREALLRESHYAWQMKLASEAWETRDSGRFVHLMRAADDTDAELRGFEWHYLQKLRKPGVQTLTGHSKSVTCVAYSPDERFLATSSDDGQVKIWKTGANQMIGALDGHTSCVNEVHFAPDGTWIATASCDGTIKLWEAETLRELVTLDTPRYLVYSLAISPNGKLIAAGLGDERKGSQTGDVILWDVTTKTQAQVLAGHQDDVHSVTFSPDGRILATASSDNTVRLWDVASGRELHVLRGHIDRVFCVRFSNDGATLVSASGDGTAIVWDQTDWRPKRFIRNSAAVYSLALSPDGALLATGNGNGMVELWFAATGFSHPARLHAQGRIQSLVFGREGRQLAIASSNNVARIWDIREQPGLISRIDLGTQLMKLALDASLSKAAFFDSGWALDRWDLTVGKRARRIRPPRPNPEPIYDVNKERLKISPTGKVVAFAAPDGRLEIRDFRSGTEITTLDVAPGSRLIKAEFLDDRSILGIVQRGNAAAWRSCIWEVAASRLIYHSARHKNEVTALAVQPEAGLFAVAVEPGSAIELYALHTGQLVARLDGHRKRINQLAFSPEAIRLASCSDDGTTGLWRWDGGTTQSKMLSHPSAVTSIAFSPDGRTLASGCGNVILWNTESGQPMIRLNPQYKQINKLQFSTDGQRLACWSVEPKPGGKQELRVWSIEK